MQVSSPARPRVVELPDLPEEIPGPRWYGDDLVLDALVLLHDGPGAVPVRTLPPRRIRQEAPRPSA